MTCRVELLAYAHLDGASSRIRARADVMLELVRRARGLREHYVWLLEGPLPSQKRASLRRARPLIEKLVLEAERQQWSHPGRPAEWSVNPQDLGDGRGLEHAGIMRSLARRLGTVDADTLALVFSPRLLQAIDDVLEGLPEDGPTRRADGRRRFVEVLAAIFGATHEVMDGRVAWTNRIEFVRAVAGGTHGSLAKEIGQGWSPSSAWLQPLRFDEQLVLLALRHGPATEPQREALQQIATRLGGASSLLQARWA